MIGPRRVKADLLGEARDGLVDAAEAYLDAGLPLSEAVARALADFGGHAQVAADYQAELAAAQGRRTAALVAIVMPAMALLSRLMWMNSPWVDSGPPPAAPYLLVAHSLDVLQVTAAIMALLTLLGYGWGSRFLPAARIPAPVVLARLMGVGVLVFALTEIVIAVVIYAWSVHTWPVSAGWPPLLVGVALIPLCLLAVGRSGLRCLRAGAVLTG
nr:permease prefix domain 1-containing protein [Planosporangium thailandense]